MARNSRPTRNSKVSALRLSNNAVFREFDRRVAGHANLNISDPPPVHLETTTIDDSTLLTGELSSWPSLLG